MTRFGVQYATEGAAESGRALFPPIENISHIWIDPMTRSRTEHDRVSSPLLGSSPSSRTLLSDEPELIFGPAKGERQ
jgi:hypothetical protein